MSNLCCDEMEKHLAEGEVAIVYIPELRVYGIKILDGGPSFQRIYYCPWCGQKLPDSLRLEWFEAIEKLGLEIDDPNIPQEYLSDKWWRDSLQK